MSAPARHHDRSYFRSMYAASDDPMAGTDVPVWIDGLDCHERIVRHVDRDFEAGVWQRRHEPARAMNETTLTGATEATGENHAH